MIGKASVRRLAAMLAVVYAAVLLVGLPLHGLLEAREGAGAPAAAGSKGPAAACPGGPCREPSHHHPPRPAHDPATCPGCSAAARLVAPASTAPVAAAAAPIREPLLLVVAPRPASAAAARRFARGPPALS